MTSVALKQSNTVFVFSALLCSLISTFIFYDIHFLRESEVCALLVIPVGAFFPTTVNSLCVPTSLLTIHLLYR